MKLTKTELEHVLKSAPQIKIGIIGEICLDRYIMGDMVGISREAPIPVINIESDEYLPGGAGNTTLNARALGTQVFPISVLGDDIPADIINRELEARGISQEFIIRQSDRHTQCYSKVYASSYRGKYQQVSRFDQKNYKPISAASEKKMRDHLARVAAMADALIIADYAEVAGTGSITEAIYHDLHALAQAGKVITIGDSRERVAWMKYFTAIVPNDVEVAMTLFPGDYQTRPFQDEEHAREYAVALQKLNQCKYVISTRGDKGAIIADGDGKTTLIPTARAEGEIDVTGAGDCFGATLAAALSARISIESAVELANLAAGITVKKLNTTGVAYPDEIRQTFTTWNV